VNPTHFTDAGLRTQVDWVRDTAGARFDRLELHTLVQGVVLTPDRRSAAGDVQPLLPTLSIDEILSSPYSFIGTAAQIADQLRERRETLGVSYITVFEKDIAAMSDVVELLKW